MGTTTSVATTVKVPTSSAAPSIETSTAAETTTAGTTAGTTTAAAGTTTTPCADEDLMDNRNRLPLTSITSPQVNPDELRKVLPDSDESLPLPGGVDQISITLTLIDTAEVTELEINGNNIRTSVSYQPTDAQPEVPLVSIGIKFR